MNSTAFAPAPSVPEADSSALAPIRERAKAMVLAAAANADAVDRDARFPQEAFDVARTQRLLGMQVPAHLGGDGASVSDVVDVCYMLGQACSATGMIFAMHQIMVGILVRHGTESAWHQDFLRRVASEQLLLASSTTENMGGGNVRSSTCFVDPSGDNRFSLTKNATVMSYGAAGDAVVTTARRSADAASSDQVLVVLLKKDYTLDRIKSWDTLGMRGTCSTGFTLTGTGELEQVLPVPYEKIHSHSMMPIAHLTWGGAWSGAAAGAVARARKFVRNAARTANGQMPPGAAHLTRAVMSLRALRSQLESALRRFESAGMNAEIIESLDFQTVFNLLKVNASEMSIATVMNALQATGLSGYRADGEFSVGRALRDVLSSAIMINNDRILASAANASMLVDIPPYVRD